jgi:hypothetical protein
MPCSTTPKPAELDWLAISEVVLAAHYSVREEECVNGHDPDPQVHPRPLNSETANVHSLPRARQLTDLGRMMSEGTIAIHMSPGGEDRADI